MKVLRLLALFIVILVGLMLIIFNSKLIGRKWLFINTRSGPLNLNSNSQTNLFFDELGKIDGALVFLRNRKIESMKGYQAWNPLRSFDNRIVSACKVNNLIGLVNIVFIDVDASSIKSSSSQTKVNNFLPNLTLSCLADSLMNSSLTLSNDKIQKLIDLSQGMLVLK